MSITVSTDVFCDGCGCWVHGVTGSIADVRAARRVAFAQHGYQWVRRNGGRVDLCPECLVVQP